MSLFLSFFAVFYLWLCKYRNYCLGNVRLPFVLLFIIGGWNLSMDWQIAYDFKTVFNKMSQTSAAIGCHLVETDSLTRVYTRDTYHIFRMFVDNQRNLKGLQYETEKPEPNPCHFLRPNQLPNVWNDKVFYHQFNSNDQYFNFIILKAATRPVEGL
jgi:hypothetical protein